ncbi:antitoxin VapB family protein [Candidatus Woesearchaeota archaeon]|nr:antitoxin VapB family protein [Candidatus Woesearchaeota archaeon]
MTKMVSLSDDAYKTIQGIKGSGESFSDVVLRIVRKKGDIMRLFGCAKQDKEFISGLKKAYQERHSRHSG